MAVKLIRENSDTPNVSNKDDARMIRYAYGGYDGYIKNRGKELSATVSGNKFTLNSGVIVLQGWEVEIDSDGWSISASVQDQTRRYFTVYCEVSLADGGTAKIKAEYDTGAPPRVPSGDDLTNITNGTARLSLYRFEAKGGVISNVEKIVKPIEYLTNTVSKINQRLDAMGFKEASVENGEISVNADWTDATPEGSIVKMAKLAVLKKLSLYTHTKVETHYLSSSSTQFSISGDIAVIPKIFFPKEDITVSASLLYVVYTSIGNTAIPISRGITITATVTKSGEIVVNTTVTGEGLGVVSEEHPARILCGNVGWELA